MNKVLSIVSISLVALILSVATASAQSEEALRVITPSQGQTIFGSRIPVLVSVDNLEIVDYETNRIARAGEGHIHLWLDDPNPTAESAVELAGDDFSYTDVNFGDHTLIAELVNNNHIPLRPPVVTTIEFKSSPAASPAPAQASKFDKNTALVILVVVSLVIAAAWWYTRDEEEMPKPDKPKPKKTTTKIKAKSRKKT